MISAENILSAMKKINESIAIDVALPQKNLRGRWDLIGFSDRGLLLRDGFFDSLQEGGGVVAIFVGSGEQVASDECFVLAFVLVRNKFGKEDLRFIDKMAEAMRNEYTATRMVAMGRDSDWLLFEDELEDISFLAAKGSAMVSRLRSLYSDGYLFGKSEVKGWLDDDKGCSGYCKDYLLRLIENHDEMV